MNTPQFRLGFERKVGYSFLGLLAGNSVSVAIFSINAALSLIPLNSIVSSTGSLRDRVLQVLAMSLLFGEVSLVSWVIIGLPVVFSLSVKLIARLHWTLASLIGAVLGASALALLYSLDGWQRTVAGLKIPGVLRTDLTFLAVAVVIAGVAFSVYCALVRRAAQRKSDAPSSAPQFFSIF